MDGELSHLHSHHIFYIFVMQENNSSLRDISAGVQQESVPDHL